MNSVSIKFAPRSKSKKSGIQATINWGYFETINGKNRYIPLRVSVGKTKVEPFEWDATGEIPTVEFSQGDGYALFKEIQKFKMKMEAICKEFIVKEIPLTPTSLKEEYDIRTKNVVIKSPLPLSIMETIDKLHVVKKHSKETKIAYYQLRKELSEFSMNFEIKLSWSRFRAGEYELFLDEVQAKDISENTKWKVQKEMNAVINFAKTLSEQEVRVKAQSRFKQIPKIKAALSWKEFNMLKDYSPAEDLHPNVFNSRKKVHKILMVLLATGVRISDLWKVLDVKYHTRDEDGNLYAHFQAQKRTSEQLTEICVPILPVIENIVLKEAPEYTHEQKVRDGIKNIMKEVFGSDYTVNVKGSVIPLAENFGPHCARSSFMTLWQSELIIPTPLIQSVMGHSIDYGNSSSATYDGTSASVRARLFRKCALSTERMGAKEFKLQVA
jgi:integrase